MSGLAGVNIEETKDRSYSGCKTSEHQSELQGMERDMNGYVY